MQMILHQIEGGGGGGGELGVASSHVGFVRKYSIDLIDRSRFLPFSGPVSLLSMRARFS